MVIGAVRGRVSIGDGPSQYLDEPIKSEDIDMPRDKLAAIVGDGKAKVTCSFELSDKDYGNGFSAHVAVTLTCNQEEEDVDRAADLASALACKFSSEMIETAEAVYKATLGDRDNSDRRRR